MRPLYQRSLQMCRRTYHSMRTFPGHGALVGLTLCASLFVLGLHAMALHNIQRVIAQWGRAGHIACFLADDAVPATWPAVLAKLQALPGAQSAQLVTPGEARRRFAARGPSAAALVEGVPQDVLPAFVELYVAGGFTDTAAVAALGKQAEAVPGVVAVDVGAAQFAALRALGGLVRLGGVVFIAAVMLAATLVCASTIRLVVQARSDEIAIMQLVGGTASFVTMPYLLQGVIWGSLSGGVVACGLWLGERYVAPRLSAAAAALTGDMPLHLYNGQIAAGLLLCGIALGVGGSALAVQRYLHVELS